MKLQSFFIGCLLVAASVSANANDDRICGPVDPIKEYRSKNDILGNVYHEANRKPLRDVTITAYSTAKKEKAVTTDNNGNYSFDDLKPGVYKLVFEREGYRKVVKEKVSIKTDEGQQLNVGMNEEEKDFNWLPGFHFSGGE